MTKDNDAVPLTELPESEVITALEQLEDAMSAGERSLSHDEVRPSTYILAMRAKEAYETLVQAHPDYELTEGE